MIKKLKEILSMSYKAATDVVEMLSVAIKGVKHCGPHLMPLIDPNTINKRSIISNNNNGKKGGKMGNVAIKQARKKC